MLSRTQQVDNPQLSLGVVGFWSSLAQKHSLNIGFELTFFLSEGESHNQKTTGGSTLRKSMTVTTLLNKWRESFEWKFYQGNVW